MVLGSKGMLGQEIVRQIKAADFDVTAWDKDELDITDKKVMEEKISKLNPEVIINCVAYNDVEKAEGEGKEMAFKINSEAVGDLAKIAAKLGALLVHYSTDYVFDGAKIDGYTESDMPNPLSQYGKSKLAGEKEILKVKNLKYYIIRTSRLFGPAGGLPHRQAGGKISFVEKMLERAKSPEPIEVINEVVSTPTYVVDLARATIEMINNQAPFGLYHRSNSGQATWYEWAKKIFELAGQEAKLAPVSAAKFNFIAPRPANSVLLSTKLPPMRKWEDALKEYIKIFNFPT